MSYLYCSCPCCEDIKEFVDDRLFELRLKPRMTKEKGSLSHIQNIIYQFKEIKVATTTTATMDCSVK